MDRKIGVNLKLLAISSQDATPIYCSRVIIPADSALCPDHPPLGSQGSSARRYRLHSAHLPITQTDPRSLVLEPPIVFKRNLCD